MFTITVRRTETSYSVKPTHLGLAACVVLPRPLLPHEVGLPSELVEKITTCRKHEIRELSNSEYQLLAQFAPKLAQPPTQHVPETHATDLTNAPMVALELRCSTHVQALKRIGANGIAQESGQWAVFEIVWTSFTCPQGDHDDCAKSWRIEVLAQ